MTDHLSPRHVLVLSRYHVPLWVAFVKIVVGNGVCDTRH